MKRATAIFSPKLRNYLLSSPKLNHNPNPPMASLTARYSGLNFFSSDSESSKEPNFVNTQKLESTTDDFVGANKEEVEKLMRRLKDGDENAMPDLFESILNWKLAGINKDDTRCSGLNYFSSNSESSKEPNFANTQKPESATDDYVGANKEEDEKLMQRLKDGDENAIQDIFMSILDRKLAGINKDDDLIEGFGKGSMGMGKTKDGDFSSNNIDIDDSDSEEF